MDNPSLASLPKTRTHTLGHAMLMNMHFNRLQKIVSGFVVFGVVIFGGVIANNIVRESSERSREVLETMLSTSDGPQFGTISRNTPHFDGGPVSIIETSFTASDVSKVQSILQERLTVEGFKLTCPGGPDTSAPSLQDHTTEPRQKCGVNGRGANGTIWLGTDGAGTQMSAIVGF